METRNFLNIFLDYERIFFRSQFQLKNYGNFGGLLKIFNNSKRN